MSDCTFQALSKLTGDTVSSLKKYFSYGIMKLPDGSDRPPGIHRVMDYLMSVGVSLTPIMRVPTLVVIDETVQEFTPEEAEERWMLYTNNYHGLLMGQRRGVGHMVYLDHGLITDRDEQYDISECEKHLFIPDTFMVATWQA